MYTRKQYLNSECTHHEYYAELASECNVKFGAGDIEKFVIALKNDDEHLNSIPLAWWDLKGLAYRDKLSKSLKIRGGFIAESDVVCMLKAAARAAVITVANYNGKLKCGAYYKDGYLASDGMHFTIYADKSLRKQALAELKLLRDVAGYDFKEI